MFSMLDFSLQKNQDQTSAPEHSAPEHPAASRKAIAAERLQQSLRPVPLSLLSNKNRFFTNRCNYIFCNYVFLISY